MPYKGIHDRISEKFYEAKREGKITSALQLTFDKLHDANWLNKEKADRVALNDLVNTNDIDDKLTALSVDTKAKDALITAIGDWTK